MTPTEQGAYCEKCATNTFDFRNKNAEEINLILRQHLGQHVCGQLTQEQIDAMNTEFEQWSFRSQKSFQSAFVLSLLVVFGLGLFSCQDQRQATEINAFRQATQEIVNTYNTVDPLLSDAAFGAFTDASSFIPEEQPEEVEEVWEISYGGAIAYDVAYGDYLYERYPDPEIIEVEYEAPMWYPEEEEQVIEAPAPVFSAMAFPNPTTENVTLELQVPNDARYEIALFDMSGRFHGNLYSGEISAGQFRQPVELIDLPTGMYLIVIISDGLKETVRVNKL